MKLKSIEISGFKSFADKTEIKFQNGITGIVGPNGSGKSNITEAIRWVMGEQSAKSLRGGKMPDVIFSGTETRKPLARASVTAIFDNTDHFLKSEFSEVMISRKLYRNGESQYQINRNDCRLRDILNLFIDTGLGKESFSIISQGRVESIFSSKPEDRRAIIEEVAGVLEYKQNKIKAENELGKTSEYLKRVNDLINELDKQRNPLEEQASLAKDFIEQKTRYDILDRTRLIRTIDANSEKSTNLSKTIKETDVTLQEFRHTLSKQEHLRDSLRQQITLLTQKKDSLQNVIVELTRKEEQITGVKNLAVEREKYRTNQIKSLDDEIVIVQQDISKSKQQLQAENKDQEVLEQEVNKLSGQIADLMNLSKTFDANKLQHQIDGLRATYMDVLQELTSVRNERSFLKKSEVRSSKQVTRIEEELNSLKIQQQQQETKITDLTNVVDTIQSDLQTIEDEKKEISVKGVKINQEYQQVRSEWLHKSGELQQFKARFNSLNNLKDEYAGYYQGAKVALQKRDRFTGIIGPVSEIISVPSQYVVSIETALGNQLQNIVTDNEQTAKTVINYLRTNRLGRATFLPVNVLKARSLATGVREASMNSQGFLGIAAELVHVQDKFINVAKYLLGTTLIVDNLDNGTKIANQIRYRARIVTLDGDVINAGGTMSGGATKNNRKGLLAQDKEIADLRDTINQSEEEVILKESKTQELQHEGRELKNKLDAIEARQSEVKAALNDRKNELQLANERILVLKRQISGSEFELRNLSGDVQVKNELDLNDKESALEVQISKIKAETKEKQSILDASSESEEKRNQQLTNLRIKKTRYDEQLTQLQRQIGNLKSSLQSSQNKLLDLNKKKKILLGNDVIERTNSNESLETVKEKLKNTQRGIADLQSDLVQKQDELDRVNAQIETLSGQISESTNVLSQQKGQRDIAKNTVEVAIDRLRDEHETTIENARKELVDVDSEKLMQEMKLLKRGITELGTVNIGAIDEFNRVSERYDFLSSQKDDLTSSADQLNRSIDEMDREASHRFKETFDQVANEFTIVFKQMFGGGQAHLELTDPDDLLNTGIEIKAQPPGKKLQRLSLLSGGEKSLTAITLLFAILKVSPVPFCILDEVEAAFDDANVSRFAKYLKTFKDTTQFIVITHRKGTMVEADMLYGVTMQESGVSKMVSVSLEEAQKKELA
ncbi:chromosome segregation protein SMC [Pediococcus claussenii]|uniref:Chromosome partition protein Smc n=1 Tax=Pediococcus claussenii (strain ATCC BAA-344 / DSM 14800 / JCM 18046 / KCTC 3811 / LMG 21948 / P06) TaxID=701521 RepID=G8PDH0_PEDCP|nr:chromosome segregation protein SMC [Pediococcus claussenii]AEV95305.1 chromosome segregation protein SMC [Pediococcus claussenii ATCC BAA-344]ANZ68840.1 hypothetical protein AYR57_00230 [Pediococcus claussenii]ANZ70656.1 hypothetical protein AYR58_00230 [Pediococcus claussenii]KRN19513.1 smc protein [Pediococcus claussenii]